MKTRVLSMLLVVIMLCLLALTACGGEPTLADYQAIEAGTPRSEVLAEFGEPHSFLSGLYGDIYRCGDKLVIIYYEAAQAGSEDPTVTEVFITERQIKDN